MDIKASFRLTEGGGALERPLPRCREEGLQAREVPASEWVTGGLWALGLAKYQLLAEFPADSPWHRVCEKCCGPERARARATDFWPTEDPEGTYAEV